jgi:hypothetical protein
MTPQWYAFFTFVHVVATLWFAGLIVRDALHPQSDIVRQDGVPADEDDPGGGCLDRAPDVLPWLKGSPHQAAVHADTKNDAS